MNPNSTQNNTPEYFKTLPEAVQDFITDNVWEERTQEIAKKYSLGPGQTETLKDLVVMILTGLEQPDTFSDTLIKELGISRILMLQIMEDLESRVFEYALKTIKEAEKKQKIKLPEIRPESLPVVEKGETVKVNPVPKPQVPAPEMQKPQPVQPKPAYKPVSTVSNAPKFPTQKPTQNVSPAPNVSHITYKPQQNSVPTPAPTPKPTVATVQMPEKKPEPIQQPIPVPRFTMVPEDITEKTPSPTPIKIIPTAPLSPKLPEAQKPPAPQQSIPSKYSADPYREPIE